MAHIAAAFQAAIRRAQSHQREAVGAKGSAVRRYNEAARKLNNGFQKLR